MDQAAIIIDYKALRRVSVAMSERLAKMLSGEEIKAAASALGMLQGKNIDLQTEDELCVVMDYAIYNVFRDGRNAVDRWLEDDPPPEGSNELRLLRSMQNSHYTIVHVQMTIPGFGVRGLDGPEKAPIVIVDVGLSATAQRGLALATRIHSPGEGWWMTTGAALPLCGEAVDRIARALEKYQRRYGVEPTEQEMMTMIVRACIASGASRQIAYAGFGQQGLPEPVTPVSRSEPKVGRNDPCPCGSGKKYKKCCGK